MIDEFIWLGDSWPAGAELEKINADPSKSAFPILVGNQLSISSTNLAVSGTSIAENVIVLNNWLTNQYDPNKKYCVIVCITGMHRFYWSDNNGWFTVGAWLETPQVKKFYAYSFDKESVTFYNTMALGYIQAQCLSRGIKIFFVKNFGEQTVSGVGPFLLDNTLQSYLLDSLENIPALFDKGLMKGQQFFEPLDLHPNLKGHQKLADIITDKLKDQL